MAIGGDPDEIRDLARSVRSWAVDVQDTRSSVRAGSGVEWVSTSADRYRERLAEHATSIAAAHDEMIAAATALDDLAEALQARQEAIQRAMNAVNDAVDSAQRTVSRLWGWATNELSEAENAAREKAQALLDELDSPPAPGDPLWLDVSKSVFGFVKETVT